MVVGKDVVGLYFEGGPVGAGSQSSVVHSRVD